MADTKCFMASCCCFACVTVVILVLFSFSSVEVNEYALNYSGISKTINTNVYSAGIYFIGVGHHFITFPKNVQTIEFATSRGATAAPLQSRTMDGLEVQITVSFQWKIIPTQIYPLYMQYGSGYEKIYEKSATDFLTDSCTKYSAYKFFMNRTSIGTEMEETLNKFMTENMHATLEFFQLRSVDLPDAFEQAIQDTEVSKQDIQKAYAEKNQTVIQLQTQVIQAEYAANSTINIAKGNADKIVINSVATANSFKKVQQSQAQAYGTFGTDLGLTGQQLLDYIKSKLVRDRTQSGMTINLESPETEKNA